MRLFISGSAPLLAETHREWEARTGHAILERYGMTETNMNTSNPYDGERVAGTVGFPLPGVTARHRSRDRQGTGAGEIGMIEVKGPNVFKGYWRMPEKTKAEFRADGFFITGDLGKIDERGYVHRRARQGSRHHRRLQRLSEGSRDRDRRAARRGRSAVIGVPHPDFGEGVTAVVVAEKGPARARRSGVLAALEGRLAASSSRSA
jgi:malonyl-CoA/methylmalonyl-CoA synthetase